MYYIVIMLPYKGDQFINAALHTSVSEDRKAR